MLVGQNLEGSSPQNASRLPSKRHFNYKNYQDKCNSLYTVISRNRWPSGTLPRHLSNGVNQTICRWDILSRDWNVIPQHTGILRLSASSILPLLPSLTTLTSLTSHAYQIACLPSHASLGKVRWMSPSE